MEDLPFRELPESAAEPRKIQGRLLKDAIEELERRMIIEAMEEAGHHQTKAAEILGLSERMLRYKLKKYGLK
jgi:transcriptional regulator with GAF, ATPase, and Fis domain